MLQFVAIAALVAAIVGVIAAVTWTSSATLALVFEPGRDGYGDVHFVNLGDEIDRDTRALTDVRLDARFYDRLSETQWIERDQLSIDVDGGRLIAYSEQGDDGTVVAVVSGSDVTPAVEEAGRATVYQAEGGVALVVFTDDAVDRCQIYRISGIDEIERVGRGDWCGVYQSGYSVIIDGDSRGSEVSLFKVDGSTIDFRTDETAAWGRLSPDGGLLALKLVGPESGDSVGVDLVDTSTGVTVNELRTSLGSGVWLSPMLNDGLFVTVSSPGGDEQVLHSLTREDSSVVAVADRVDVVANPPGTRVLVRTTFWDDGVNEYSVGTLSTGYFDGVVEVDSNVENPFGWVYDNTALTVDRDGSFIQVFESGSRAYGEVGDDSGWGWLTPHDGGLATIQTTSPGNRDTVTVFSTDSPGGARALSAGSIEILQTSWNGRWVVMSGRDDPDDEYVTLYVYDPSEDELVEVDEGESFAYVQFVDGMIKYAVFDGNADPETRQVAWRSGARPETLYRDAIAISP